MPKSGNKRKKEEEEENDSTSDSGPDEEPPKKEKESKSQKTADKGKSANAGSGNEERFELSNKKFVHVSTFKNRVQVDIREYYLDSKGDLQPGRKGITLNPVQWEQLKGVMADIDAAVLKRI